MEVASHVQKHTSSRGVTSSRAWKATARRVRLCVLLAACKTLAVSCTAYRESIAKEINLGIQRMVRRKCRHRGTRRRTATAVPIEAKTAAPAPIAART